MSIKQAIEALEAALSDDQPYIEKSRAALAALRSMPQGEPVATLWVQMETHDMGQSLAPNPPFKVAIAKAHAAAKALPLGEYLLYHHAQPAAEPAQQDAVDADWKVGPLTDELTLILGRPNFTCIHYAEMLRELGQEIPRKAEAEQAAVIHWMLGFYATHGDKWAEAAVESVNSRHAAFSASKGTPQ